MPGGRALIYVDVKGDMKKILRDMWMVSRKLTPAATAKALNRTGTTVRAQTARAATAALGFPKVGIIKKRLQKGRASRRRLSIPLYVKLRGINPNELDAVQTETGVKAGSHEFPGAFLLEPGYVAEASGRRFPGGIVFKRKKEKDYKTITGQIGFLKRKKHGLPVKAMRIEHAGITTAAMKKIINVKASTIFIKNFKSAMDYALKRTARAA